MGFGLGGLIALAVLFLGIVMLSNVGLRGIRVDLTQNRLYTLSRGTQQVLGELKTPEPVDVVWTSQNYHDFKNPGMFFADTVAMDKAIFAALVGF